MDDSLVVDCGQCAVRGLACAECVVTVLLGPPPEQTQPVLRLDLAERRALAALASSGMVPPLRLVPSPPEESLRTG